MPVGVSAFTPLATINLSGVNGCTFSSIPTTYRDLMLVARVSTSSIGYFFATLNSTNGIYNQVALRGTGTAAQSWQYSGQAYVNFADTAYSDPDAGLIAHFLDYSVTNKHKTILSMVSAPARGIESVVNRAATTAAITSIRVDMGATITSGTMSLYGISA